MKGDIRFYACLIIAMIFSQSSKPGAMVGFVAWMLMALLVIVFDAIETWKAWRESRKGPKR